MARVSVQSVRDLLASAAVGELPSLIASLEGDPRAGVRAALASARRRVDRELAEAERYARLLDLEDDLRSQGYMVVAGVDEVGRGALAGPVTAAAVVLGTDRRIDGLDDSKRLTPERRVEVGARIATVCAASCVAHATAGEIDALGIAAATRLAMLRALDGVGVFVDHVVVDGLPVGLHARETAVVGGDARVACVAAASVLAKVARDELMTLFAADFPDWGFEQHKGYGTRDHMDAIARCGLCALHRRSFVPCGGSGSLF